MIMGGLSGSVTWEQVWPIAAAGAMVASVLYALFRWVYTDSNNTRREIQAVATSTTREIQAAAKESREAIIKVREDIAMRYVSAETHKTVADTIEKAITNLRDENRHAIENLRDENRRALEHLGERIDKTMIEASKSIAEAAKVAAHVAAAMPGDPH